MASKDESTGRLKPVIDYPFAEDGLDIWYAMRDWFGSYLAIYYTNDQQVTPSIQIHPFPVYFRILIAARSLCCKFVQHAW